MLRPALIALAAAASVWLAPSTAAACSCRPPGPPAAELAKASVVFAGTVTEVVPGQMTRSVRFESVEVIKGEPPEPLVVTTRGSSASCGYNFEPGKSYLVYAKEGQGELSVSLCSRTALYKNAEGEPVAEIQAEIQQLRGSAPADEPPGADGPREPATDPAPADTPPPATAPQKRGCAGCSSGSSIAHLDTLAGPRSK